ncbi:MAG: hypothetical protein AB8H79_13865, partial [Myxococcota bacterium]
MVATNTESLLGQTVLDAWVLSAVADSSAARHVYRATSAQGTSQVLVSVVPTPKSQDVADVDRSIQTARRERHPNLMRVLDSGRLPDGRQVIVTPATGARTLATRFVTRPPALSELLRLTAQVGRALATFHLQGQTFGPLTPEHVLLSTGSDGRDDAQLMPVWWAWRHGFDAFEAGPWNRHLSAGPTRKYEHDVSALGAIIWHGLTHRPPLAPDDQVTLTGSREPAPIPRASTLVRRRLPNRVDDLVADMLNVPSDGSGLTMIEAAEQLEEIAHTLEGGTGPVIAPPMLMTTPVPVGGQLRDRSLILPVPPPPMTQSRASSTPAPLRGLTPMPRMNRGRGALAPTDESEPPA